MQAKNASVQQESVKLFDGFTKAVLSVMFVLLAFIFVSAKYMVENKMEAGGTDDTVNGMASKVSDTQAHPFIELPGDAELGAFSIANLGVGLIVGHLWTTLFGAGARKEKTEPDMEPDGAEAGKGRVRAAK
jgi:cobalt/nickel transport protein